MTPTLGVGTDDGRSGTMLGGGGGSRWGSWIGSGGCVSASIVGALVVTEGRGARTGVSSSEGSGTATGAATGIAVGVAAGVVMGVPGSFDLGNGGGLGGT